ncbi:MAG TPA: TetR/AcrR family transcriptional regulator [Beutenbergiaceae bacterium]|nr:TetR/AcrR family transcriptional regulator [Beutenbergiaceae bacterium]
MSEAVNSRNHQRERVISAAFDLFAERGYEGTTVEAIADRAGVGRTTFFRMFRAKESVVFPAHDRLLAAIEARLTTARPGTEKVALSEASELVLEQYLREGERARQRYALTREVEALRERERASIFQYERLFRRFIHRWWGGDRETLLRAELAANAVVTAHNHVLRAWLRGEVGAEEARTWFREVIRDLDSQLSWYERPVHAPGRREHTGEHDGVSAASEGGPAVIVVRDANEFHELVPRIQELLE